MRRCGNGVHGDSVRLEMRRVLSASNMGLGTEGQSPRMKNQFTLLKVCFLITACAVCSSVVAAVGVLSLVVIPAFAVIGIGTFAAAAVTARLLLLPFARVQRSSGARMDTVYETIPTSQATSEFRRIDTVVAVAERFLSIDTDSSIVFLSPTVDDSQVAAISELSELKWLVLDYTEVTDAGLLLLSKLKKLRRVYVRGTRVTPAGIRRLQQLLPTVEILY